MILLVAVVALPKTGCHRQAGGPGYASHAESGDSNDAEKFATKLTHGKVSREVIATG